MTIEDAVEVFVRGYAATKSLTHPYVPERFGNAWVMRDGPGKRRDPRNEEWVGTGISPGSLDRLAGVQARGRFAVAWVCPLGESDRGARAEFKSLGYRLRATEPLFVHDLVSVPDAPSPAAIVRVDDPERAARLGKLLRRKPLRPEFFEHDSPWRQYVAEIDGALVGWVASIDSRASTWCANLHVAREHRRRGIAKALMARMLVDDRKLGKAGSVLLSSHTGAHLYPKVGYRQLATVLLYSL